MKIKNILLGSFCCVGFISCNNPTNNSNTHTTTVTDNKPVAIVPQFNQDSSYAYVKAQVDFGPRIPGTKSHEQCAEYLTSKMKTYTPNVTVQNGIVKTFDGKTFTIKNIIAEFNPQLGNRILLCAHWDTRPYADGDSIDKYKPFDGADDGASGVAVLLEVARQLSIAKPNVGIDIIFFDLEDYGQEQDDKRFPQQENTWCLGTQYWAKNPHKQGYTAQYGILLDMVGGKNAVFPMEGTGMQHAPDVVKNVWALAQSLGYSNFINDQTSPTMDDHFYINTIANIPCIDIVHYDIEKRNYAYWHHRHSDNLEVIDPNTLKTVGQLLLTLLIQQSS
ncbi:MAG: M28 family peptidase [Bacteroidia bacterium]